MKEVERVTTNRKASYELWRLACSSILQKNFGKSKISAESY